MLGALWISRFIYGLGLALLTTLILGLIFCALVVAGVW